jgi:hypothetical protein
MNRIEVIATFSRRPVAVIPYLFHKLQSALAAERALKVPQNEPTCIKIFQICTPKQPSGGPNRSDVALLHMPASLNSRRVLPKKRCSALLVLESLPFGTCRVDAENTPRRGIPRLFILCPTLFIYEADRIRNYAVSRPHSRVDSR